MVGGKSNTLAVEIQRHQHVLGKRGKHIINLQEKNQKFELSKISSNVLYQNNNYINYSNGKIAFMISKNKNIKSEMTNYAAISAGVIYI